VFPHSLGLERNLPEFTRLEVRGRMVVRVFKDPKNSAGSWRLRMARLKKSLRELQDRAIL
jgi:hypothetical protein